MKIENAPMEWLSFHENVGNTWDANSPAVYLCPVHTLSASSELEAGAVDDLVKGESGNSYIDKLCHWKTLSYNF